MVIMAMKKLPSRKARRTATAEDTRKNSKLTKKLQK